MHKLSIANIATIATWTCLVIVACGDSGRSEFTSGGISEGMGGTGTASTGAPPTSDAAQTAEASTDPTGGGGTGTDGEISTSTSTTSSTTSSTTGDASSGGAMSSSEPESGSNDTGASSCEIDDVEDTLGFVYVRTIDLVDIGTIQASFYNIEAEEIVFLSFGGAGRRYTIDGVALGDVQAPPEASSALDGASYDSAKEVALLLTQGCLLVEVDPVTLQTISSIQLDTAKLGLQICAGLAVGVDGKLYVNSYATSEMVRLSRDGQDELGRIDLGALDLGWPDGVSLIAGSENFLVLSTKKQQAAILTPEGVLVVPPSSVGKALPPFKGGQIINSDACLTVCGNGHAWLCDEYGTQCHEYAPEDGDKNACTCTIPQ